MTTILKELPIKPRAGRVIGTVPLRYQGNPKQVGFTLTEMMIALALGSAITLGALQLFAASEQNHRLLLGQSRVQESARFALSLLGQDIRRAGFASCLADASQIHSVLPANSLPWEFDLRSAVAGHEGLTGGWQPSLASIPSGTGQINRARLIAGADLLTLRFLASGDNSLVEATTADASSIKIAAGSLDELGFARGQLALVHDCQQATAFVVTDIALSGNMAVVHHAVGQAPDGVSIDRRSQWQNVSTDLRPVGQGDQWGRGAAVSAIASQTWFLAEGAGRTAEGAKVPSLWRKSGLANPVELVEGVETMQLVYGVDTDDDQVPNQYLDASRVSNWARVMTVQVSLVITSLDDVGLDGDGRLRQRFTQTFQLRNRA